MRMRLSTRAVVGITAAAMAAVGAPAFAGGHGGSGGGGGGGGPGTKPYIQFKAGGPYSVTEGAINAIIQVERVPKGVDSVYFSTNGSSNGAVGVTPANGCISDPAADYVMQSNQVVNIGSNGIGTATVPICDNAFFENQETVNLVLAQKSSTPVGKFTAILNINDNDKAPVLSVDNRTGAEGTVQTFTVTASAADPLLPMSFHWSTSDGTATLADGDFNTQSGNGAIAPGATTTTFDVTSLDDNVFEPGTDEYFWVNLSSPVNSSVSSTAGKGKYTVQDIDAPPTLTVNDQSVTEGGSLTFTVTRTGMTNAPATFDWSTASNGTAAAGAIGTDCTTAGLDYVSAGATGVSIASGGATNTTTFNVATCEDGTPESDETFTVNLTNAGGATISDATGAGTINDNDNPGFETGDFTSWSTEQSDAGPLPSVDSSQFHSGAYSALLGTDGVSGDEPGDGFSYLYRQIAIPATGTTTLSVWVLEHGDNNFLGDDQFGQIKDLSTNVLATIFDDTATFDPAWQNKTIDLTPWAGQTVYVLFGVHQDIPGGDPTAMWVDDLQITHTA